MANIGKYKAAASTSAKYTRGLGKVQETGYDRDWNEQQGEQQRAMYGAIGSTVQNIVGIMDEKKKQSEMTKFKDIAAGLEGIETREEQYQPLGTVGSILGLKSKTKKSYFAKESGAELTESVMGALGMKKAYTGETDYDIAPEGWVSPISPEGKIREAQKGIVPGEGPYNKETKEKMDAAAADDMTAEFERRKLRAEQIESDQVVVSEEASDPEYRTAESGGLLDNIGEKVGDTTVYDEETRTATTTVADDSAYRIAGKSDAVDRGDIVEEQSTDAEYTKEEMGEFKRKRQMERPGPDIKEQSWSQMKEEEKKQQDTVMDTMKEKERVSGLQGADAARHSISTAFQDVPGLSGRTNEATMAIGMESSYGQDKSAGGNVFQIKHEGIRGMAQDENVDLSDPAQAGKFYIKTVDKLTEDFGDYTVQTGSLKDTKFDVFKAFDAHGLDKQAVKYISWQQGRKGAVDMITAMQTGKIGDTTKKNMLNNLSESQHDELWKILQGSSGSKEDRNKQFISEWLKIQKSKMEGHGYSHHTESDVYG